MTDADGRFHYRTVKPAGYGVPDDGPVGQLLGRSAIRLRRPAHLHFIIKAAGFETLTTHVFDGGDPHLGEDALFGVKPELVGDFRKRRGRGERDDMGAGLHLRHGARQKAEASRMIEAFTYAGSPAHIVFGNGAIASVGEWVEKLGCARALVLSTPHQKADAEALAARLGIARGRRFCRRSHAHAGRSHRGGDGAWLKALGADCVVSLGGGSTTGLGKAIAYRTDLHQIVIPTTYAGSEVTPILGQTEDGDKTTVRDAQILPEMVIYDPELTLGLPVAHERDLRPQRHGACGRGALRAGSQSRSRR